MHKRLSSLTETSRVAQLSTTQTLERFKDEMLGDAARARSEIQDMRYQQTMVSGTIERMPKVIFDRLEEQNWEQILMPLVSKLREVDETCKRAEAIQRVTSTLRFKSMRLRDLQIPLAHANTFSWIFDHPPFAPWLASSSGLFWINGKAGSGKSTLMKFIAGHPKTTHLLESWANGRPVVQASFFFCSSGYPVQKSQEGLLRSLLYQLFSRCTDLIALVCPQRWTDAVSNGHAEPEPWTREELLDTVLKIARLENLQEQLCFFTDGLDEYSGDHFELVRTLAKLSASPSVKLCVSSRPWNIFGSAYGTLAGRDMDLFINDCLEHNDTFRALTARDPQTSRLTERIRNRAQGVFPWVILVVRSLLRGLSEDDTLGMLVLRLDEIPDTLEEYFRAMIESVEKVYRPFSGRCLLIAITPGTPLPLLSYWHLETTIVSSSEGSKIGHKPYSPAETVEIQRKARSLVNKWCRDLLEVVDDRKSTASRSPIFHYKVVFLHRTVQDFLLQPETQKLLYGYVDKGSTLFRPEMALAKIFLIHAKIHDRTRTCCQKEFDFIASSVMHFVRLYEQRYGRTCSEVVHELDSVGNEMCLNKSPWHWTDAYARIDGTTRTRVRPHRNDTVDGLCYHSLDTEASAFLDSTHLAMKRHRHRNLLAYAVECDLQIFVGQWLKLHPRDVTKTYGAPLIYHALDPVAQSRVDYIESGRCQGMVRSLFDAGADANEKVEIWDGDTVWSQFLQTIAAHRAFAPPTPHFRR